MIRRTHGLAPLSAAIFALSLAGAGTAAAQAPQGHQDRQQGQQGAKPQSRTPSFSDSDVASFANAVKDMQKIRHKYQPQMKNAKDKKEAQGIQMKAQTEMVAAIQDEGLTVQKYAAISKAIPNDPDLVKRIRAKLEK